MSRSTRLRKRDSAVQDHQPSSIITPATPQTSIIAAPTPQTAAAAPQNEIAQHEQVVAPSGHQFGSFSVYADGWSQAAAPPAPPAAPAAPAAPSAGGSPGFTVQTRLAVNAPGDAFEQEADRVAEQVMRSPDGDAADPAAAPGLRVQRASSEQADVSPGLESSISQMQSGGGSPLPASERAFFEQRMGHDFGQIRIHNDARANQTADGLHAHAFTVGSNIAFAAGQYQPGSESGRHLLAHELTHTIQQTGGVATKRIQRKEAEREPAADEGVCPVCGKVGKGTCPGCGSPFLPIQRKARSDQPDDEIELKTETNTEAKTEPAQPAGSSAEAAPEQRQPTAQPGAEAPSAAGATPEQAGAEAAKETTAALTEVAPTADKPAAAEANKKAEDAGPGNPVLQAVQQSAADGPAKALDQQSQRLRDLLSTADPKAAGANAVQQPQPGQADPALQDALGQVTTGRDEAKAKADAATGELASSQDAIGQLAGTPVELAPLDIATLLKEAGMDSEAADSGPAVTISRKEADGEPLGESVDPTALQALVEQLRAQAQGMVSSFMGNATGRVQGALALGQAAPARLQAPVAAAQAEVQAAVQAQSAALTAQFAQTRSDAQSQAEAQRALIESRHTTALAAIQSSSTQTTQQIEQSYQQAVQRIQQQEQTQAQTLTQRYALADTEYRAAGTKVGQEAVGIGEEMAQGYLAGKINRDDSFLDGDLTDRRCEARAKAAREVAKQYQQGLVEEANKQASEGQKGLPRDIETLGTVRTEALTQLETQQRTQLEQARAAAEAAQQQAEQAKIQFLDAVEQTLSGTMQTLSEQETSQLQGLETMGQQQAAGLEQAGQSTIAALTQSVTQAVSGLQGSLGGIPGALAGVQIPDPEALGGALEGAMGQIEGGLATLQGQIEQGVATAEQQFAQQSQQVVQTLSATGQEVTGSVGELMATLTSSFAQLQSGVESTYSQIGEAFTNQMTQLGQAATEGFTQVVTGTEQAFGQMNTNVDTAFDQAAPALENGLRGALGEMRSKIGEEAEKAAAEEQPRWKGILKIILIIAVIVVVALVIGPFVIGAVGAAAGALGASAAAATAIGAVVGGAIVGAGSSAVIQMGSNLIDGKPVLDGVVQALITGAIGGALGGLGGLAGQGVANALRMGSGFAQGALKFGVDLAFDTAGGILGNLATGQPITLDGVMQGLLSGGIVSLSMGGLGKLGRLGQGIEGIQQRSMAAGQSFGTNVGTAVRPTIGLDAPSVRPPTVDVGTPSRPEIDTGNTPAPRTNVDEPDVIPPPRTNIDEPDVPPAPRTNVDEPSATPRNTVGDESNAPTGRSTAPDEPSTTPRTTEEPSLRRSSHTDEPQVEPGVVAKQEVEGGHEVKVLRDGRIVRCSTCGELRMQYASELAADPKLKADLDRIEAIPDPRTKVEEAAKLQNQLDQARQNSQASNNRGAKLAEEAGLPPAPDGYYWTRDGGGIVLKRNPSQADSLLPLRFDPDSPTKFLPDVTPPKDYKWQPKGDGTYDLVPSVEGMPPIKYDPSKGGFIDTGTGRLYVPPELAGGNWGAHTYGDPKVIPCFAPGTPVKTPQGERPIESLRVGDLVYAYDFTQNAVVKSPVLQLYQSQTQHLVDVQVAGRTIKATRQHRFWVENAGDWLPAAQLEAGMTLKLVDGSSSAIQAVEVYPAASPTFNLEVAQAHTYFVGPSGALVHNGDEDISNFGNTTKSPGRIYIITDIDGKVIYVGKTRHGDVMDRFKEHLRDKPDWRQRYDQGLINRPQQAHSGDWTDYETAVWEKHFIDQHSQGNVLENDPKTPPISEAKYNEFKHLHSPCT